MAPDTSEPISQNDCDRCNLRREVSDVKGWIKRVEGKADRVDGRMWGLMVLGVTNLLGVVTTLLILLIKWAPAAAAAAGK